MNTADLQAASLVINTKTLCIVFISTAGIQLNSSRSEELYYHDYIFLHFWIIYWLKKKKGTSILLLHCGKTLQKSWRLRSHYAPAHPQRLWKIQWDQGAYFHVHSFKVMSVSKKEYCRVWRGFLHNTRERRSSRSCCLLSLDDTSEHNRFQHHSAHFSQQLGSNLQPHRAWVPNQGFVVVGLN